jgi:hypothetical protein
MTRRMPREPTCAEMVRLVTEYLEDALPIEDRTRFEQHLVFCQGCAEYLRQMRTTIEASRTPRGEELSDETKERLLRAFRGLCK